MDDEALIIACRRRVERDPDLIVYRDVLLRDTQHLGREHWTWVLHTKKSELIDGAKELRVVSRLPAQGVPAWVHDKYRLKVEA